MKPPDLIRRWPILSFTALTYLISWVAWSSLVLAGIDTELLRVVGGFGPTLAALALIPLVEGRSGYRRLGRSLIKWRVGWSWWLVSLLSTAFLAGLALVSHSLLEGNSAGLEWVQPWYVIFIAFPYVLLTSVLGEEIGWRGFALPRLQRRFSALGSSLILGGIWGLWHLPLFFIPGNFHQDLPLVLFLSQSILITIFMTWLFNNTGGSLLLAHIFHAASNVTFFMLPVLPAQASGHLRPLILTIGLAFIAVAALVAGYGQKHLSKFQQETSYEYS